MSVSFLPSGDTGLTVQLGHSVDNATSARVISLRAAIDEAQLEGVIETVPTYRSLLVHYDPLLTTQSTLIAAIRPMTQGTAATTAGSSTHWAIPVCFESDFAPDLPFVAETADLTPDEVITHMTGLSQAVYMLGFAPGQPYLGDLPECLNIPRRQNPVQSIPAGSVVIATGKTTIYPVANPTGWYVLGRTPIALFDATSTHPALFSPGDTVSFDRITRDEFGTISHDIKAGTYTHRKTTG